MYPCLIPGKHSASTRTPSFPLLSPRRIEGTPGAPGIGAARPAETRLRSPEHLTGNRGRLGDDREGSGTTVPPRRQGRVPAHFGEEDGRPVVPAGASCSGHQGRPSPGRGHTFVNRDYRGPWGRLGRLDMSACVRVVRTSGRVGNMEKV